MTMVTRSELFELVWAEPMLCVAKRFNVSASYLARICTRLNVPRPARGYWTKLAVGKAPPRDTLPAALAGDEISWNPDGGMANVARASAVVPKKPGDPRKVASRAAFPPPTAHPLLANARPLFLAGSVTISGDYLKPSKRLLPDLQVTKATLDPALELINALFLACERRGHRVTLASIGEQISRLAPDTRDKPDRRPFHNNLWSPCRNTVIYVTGTPIGLTLFEITESTEMTYVNGKYVRKQDRVAPKSFRSHVEGWTSMQEIPCGRLCLQAYASYYDSQWNRQWKEARQGEFLTTIAALVGNIERCQPEADSAIQTGRQRAESEKRRLDAMFAKQKMEQEETKRLKAIADSRNELMTVLNLSEQHDRLARFISKIEAEALQTDAHNRLRLQTWITEARKLIGKDSTLSTFMGWRPPSGEKY